MPWFIEIWNSYKLIFFILYNVLFIFFTFARELLQHLLENNQLLYPLRCSLLTPTYWLSIRYIFKTSNCHSDLKIITISFANKIVQNNTDLKNIHCKVGTDIKRSLKNSPFITQNSKSTIHMSSCSAQAKAVHSFFKTKIRSTKRSKYISV